MLRALNYPPIVPASYTQYEAALIAGFIIYYRGHVLHAIMALEQKEAESVPRWRDPQLDYYQRAEQYTRYLLGVIGYHVQKGENYGEQTIIPPETIGQLGSLDQDHPTD